MGVEKVAERGDGGDEIVEKCVTEKGKLQGRENLSEFRDVG